MRFINILILVFSIIGFSSCATLIGGYQYQAEVIVKNHPNAKINYNGNYIGKGRAYTSIRRRDANHVHFNITEDGFESTDIQFKGRTFRGWALLGSIFSFNYYFIPVGLIYDISKGSFWKPSLYERGISKVDYHHYKYELDYTGKKIKTPPTVVVTKKIKDSFYTTAEKLRDLKKLLDEEIIDEEEYKIMKRKIIGNEESIDEVQDIKEEKTTKIEESEEKKKVAKPENEKLNDLNKMLELELITEEEYNEMKSKLIDQ